MAQSCQSDVLDAFRERFVERYETLRNLKRGRGLAIQLAIARHTDSGAEAKRAFALASRAATEWAPWALASHYDPAHEQARSYLSNIDLVTDRSSAHEAEGWLRAARDALGGDSSTRVLGAACEAAAHAGDIELDVAGVDNTEAVLGTAQAAGEALAAAGVAVGDPQRTIAEALATGKRLQ